MYIHVYITTKDGSLRAWQAVNKSKDIEINTHIYMYIWYHQTQCLTSVSIRTCKCMYTCIFNIYNSKAANNCNSINLINTKLTHNRHLINMQISMYLYQHKYTN